MSTIDKARWEALSSLLDELLELDEAAREERLKRLGQDDRLLAEELAALLRQQTTIERAAFLEDSPLHAVAKPSLSGQVVGSYTLDRPLGQGGMGTVWLASRSDGRYEGHVAIKLLNLALIGYNGIGRFQREGSVLARLAHPNIARLLDAGVTQVGQPYLVLEYVEGEPIDRWCNARALDAVARVRLFMEVLAAVMHAHSHLILHRDLKPSNILVNADGRVKLLDFGLAKLLDDKRQSTPMTELSQLAGQAFTPEFASPEQVQGEELTMATDVYALGLILYVLLTGEHATARTGQGPLERLRAVVDTVPPLSSEAVLRSAKSQQGESAAVSEQLARTLRGDLDNIVAKMLKKAPGERYTTVAALAEDLRRYLDHEPVSARADSFSYRTSRFVARNWLAVGATALGLVAIVCVAAVALWQAREASGQRDRVLTLAARNEAVIDFIRGMLTEVTPADQTIRVADLLERSQSILMSEQTEPGHQAAILGLLSDYFVASGDPSKAEASFARALALARASSDTALQATLLCSSAQASLDLGRPPQAQAALNEGLQLSQGDPLAAAKCLRARAQLAQLSNDPKGALDFALQALARLQDSPVPKPDLEALVLGDVAVAHHLGGRPGETDRYFRAALARLTELGRGETATAATMRNSWGSASAAAGDFRLALQQRDEAIRIASRYSIDGRPDPVLLANRANELAALARFPEALATFDQTIELATQKGHARARMSALVNRAGAYLAMGELSRAEQETTRLLSEVGKTIAPGGTESLKLRLTQARLHAALGRLPEALTELSALVETFESRRMLTAPLNRVLVSRAEVYLQQGDLDAATSDAQRALQIARTIQGDKKISAYTGATHALLGRIYESRGELVQARDMATQAAAHLSEALGAEHPETRAAQAAALKLQRVAVSQ